MLLREKKIADYINDDIEISDDWDGEDSYLKKFS